ncbi:MAG: cysteine synthase A [Clostridia bacterium]|nr:cysteine synthase A [Clostridia bacterium]
MKIYESVKELIGNTPVLELKNFSKALNLKGKIYAKLEFFNPTGSVKDRAVLGMIEKALTDGQITEGATVIEPTSGNTGIGIASLSASLNFKAVLVMPDTMSKERIAMLKAYGAAVVLTDGALGMQGAIDEARRLQSITPNSFIPNQFDNPANADAHYKSTGKEIWEDTDGNIDYFVAGIGSAGTLVGTSKYLKEKNPKIKTVGVEPLSSPLITKGISGAHKIQGIGANFIPKNYDKNIVDQVLTASDEDSVKYARLVAKTEGIFVGISSGAALSVATLLAKDEQNANKNIVVIFPDSGDRYLSTELIEI